MRFTNLSTIPSKDLKTLVRFVLPYMEFGTGVNINVFSGTLRDCEGNPTCSGKAFWSDRKCGARVEVGINPNATYPRTQRLAPGTPLLAFNSWEEEFVAVLAHELRHVDQFRSGLFHLGEEAEAEVDAERAAARVLAEYKKLTP